MLVALVGYCNCAKQDRRPWTDIPPMKLKAYPMPEDCYYRIEDCMQLPLHPAYVYRVESNFSLPCQLVQQTFVPFELYWYKLKPDGTLAWLDGQRRNTLLHTTFLVVQDVKLDFEGIYLCSVLSGLNRKPISDAYKPLTKPIFTYIMILTNNVHPYKLPY